MTSKSPSTPSTSQNDEKNFPVRLHYMLNELEKDHLGHIIGWQPHGRCFVVHDQKVFVEEILPLWFRQSKFPSFQRQLNLYGFTRLTKGKDKNGYHHPLFLRGNINLSEQIKRIKVKGNGPRKPSCPEKEPNFYLAPPLDAGAGSSETNSKGSFSSQTTQGQVSVSDSASHTLVPRSVDVPVATRLPVVLGNSSPSYGLSSLIDIAAASILSRQDDQPRDNDPSALAMYFLKKQRQQELTASIYGRLALHLLDEATPAPPRVQQVTNVHVQQVTNAAFPADMGQVSSIFQSAQSDGGQTSFAFNPAPADSGNQASTVFHSTSVLPTLVDRILGDLSSNPLLEDRTGSQENLTHLP